MFRIAVQRPLSESNCPRTERRNRGLGIFVAPLKTDQPRVVEVSIWAPKEGALIRRAIASFHPASRIRSRRNVKMRRATLTAQCYVCDRAIASYWQVMNDIMHNRPMV
jgi:hypothetical protein